MHKLTITEACELANVSRPTIYKYIKNGTISVIKDGKNTHIDASELLRVFPDVKLNVNTSSVNTLHSLTTELTHKGDIIRMLTEQLSDKQKDNEFLKIQLTQINENLTTVNKFLQDKTIKKRKKFLWIF
jgi:excisionase family DNA binding protein